MSLRLLTEVTTSGFDHRSRVGQIPQFLFLGPQPVVFARLAVGRRFSSAGWSRRVALKLTNTDLHRNPAALGVTYTRR